MSKVLTKVKTMNYTQAEKMLKSCGQEHVLAYWKKLTKREQGELLEQIAKIELKNVKYCQSALKAGGAVADSSKGKAPKVADLKGAALRKAVAAGEKELRAGRVAACCSEAWKGVVLNAGYLAVCWVILYFLYRKNVFLKV